MSRGEPLRVVCYAVNGTGVGHVTRLLAVARWLRRYAAALDQKLEIWFLTSSEADGLVFAEGFAAFKIPSKTVVAEAGIDRRTYLALAKQWVWHTLGLLRPDLLVVDTFPRGSFGELLGALDLCRRTAFVYRPVRREVAERPDFQAMLSLYDLLIVPERSSPVLVPPQAEERLVHVGHVLARERWEWVPRAVARARLGVPDGAKCVYVSAGGGGDREARARLEQAVRAISGAGSIHVVVGTGPLYRGEPLAGVTILPGRAAEWCLAFDAAIGAAGYNTYGELMFAGVPTVFFPQDKLADDQQARARLAVEAGAGAILEAQDDVERIRRIVTDLLARPGAAGAARALVPENGARTAAAELLRLVFPPAEVDRVEATLDEARWERVRASGSREIDVLSIASRLAHDRAGELGVAVDRSSLFLGDHEAREIRGLVDAVVRGLPSSPVPVRAGACEAALAALGALAPGDGAAARAVVADARWGDPASSDGASLAREVLSVRSGQETAPARSSSSLRSSK